MSAPCLLDWVITEKMEKHLAPNPSPVRSVWTEPTLNNWQLELLLWAFSSLFPLMKPLMVRGVTKLFYFVYGLLCLWCTFHCELCRNSEVLLILPPKTNMHQNKKVISCLNCDTLSLVTESWHSAVLFVHSHLEWADERERSVPPTSLKLLEFGLFFNLGQVSQRYQARRSEWAGFYMCILVSLISSSNSLSFISPPSALPTQAQTARGKGSMQFLWGQSEPG